MMGSKPGKRFAGLRNQGATSYLNTLLQTWFMTQEVKECITSYKEQDSLICELQCLFERLSDGNERSLSTEKLTSQLNLNVYIQRDIEECFRSLVNKVNSKMDQENNLLKIYQVTMVNSFKCLKCTQSMNEDTFFLDIPLSVCSADAAEKFDSMEKGLEQFLKEGKKEGDNKCYCNNCDMKTETASRYYFKHLPQILTFQLKRFEFDYNYMAFQKITDCITFPPVLEFTRSQDVRNEWCQKLTVNRENNAPSHDCSRTLEERQSSFSFLGVQKGTSVDYEGKHPEAVKDQSEEVSKDEEVKNVDVVKGKETLAQPREEKQEDSEDITGGNPETPQDQSQQVSTGQELNNIDVAKHEETQEVKQDHSVDITGGNPETPQDQSQQVSTGPEEKRYELFAIWHHIGSYGSGHYYAEIKSDSSDWYNFNDEDVKKEMNICLSSKTAYVLMYRPIDTNHKAEPPAGGSKKPADKSEKRKTLLDWVMEKLKLGRVMAKMAPLRVEGEDGVPWLEGEDGVPWVEGEDGVPWVEGEHGTPPGDGEDGAPPGGRGRRGPLGGRGRRPALGQAKVQRS